MSDAAIVRWKKEIHYDPKSKTTFCDNIIGYVVGFERIIPLTGEELDVVNVDSRDLTPVEYHGAPYPQDRALWHFRNLVEKYGATHEARKALGLTRFKRGRK